LLEALSRGAQDAVALDSNPAAIANLKHNLELLRCPRGQMQTDALRYLQGPAKQQFDLVFLDPPFHQDLLPTPATCWKSASGCASRRGSTPKARPRRRACLPGNWRLHREKKTGQVHYALWQRIKI
jgi:16S rRNA (guanine966-N2)-methyltransferase